MKWFRMFDEAMDDPKLDMLTSDQFRFWFKLVCLANRQKERGTLPPDDEIPRLLHLRRDAYGKMISALEARNLFVRTPSGRLKPTGWDERQRDSDDPAKRKARYREKTYVNSPSPNVPGHERDMSRDTSGTCPAPRARVFEILDSENSYTHTGENSSTLASTEDPDPLPSTPRRTGDNARLLAEAERLLGSDIRTDSLAIELSRNSNTPELIGISGWRWLRAAERILGPGRTDSQRSSLPYLAKMARGLAESEREPPAPTPPPASPHVNGTGGHVPALSKSEQHLAAMRREAAERKKQREARSDGDG